jgi:DNA-binding transcriptional regulator YdaS (Cro superfamily)
MTATKLHSLIAKAIKAKGSQGKLAKAIGCSQQQIAYLLKASSISVEMAHRIDVATDGAVARNELRPDFFKDSATEAA